ITSSKYCGLQTCLVRASSVEKLLVNPHCINDINYVLMERGNSGNLEEFIDIQPSTLSMQKDSNYHHLTPKERLLRIIHRDLKPSNLLLQYDNSEDLTGIVLISDFGECDRPGATGTLEIMAPELLTGNYNVKQNTLKNQICGHLEWYFISYVTQIEDVDILKQRNYAF
ncbi:24084_t:CDS:2, partial [Cetraspora pellucida]